MDIYSWLVSLWVAYAVVMFPIAMFVTGALLVPPDSNLPRLSRLGNAVFGVFVISLIPGIIFWAGLAVIVWGLLTVVGKVWPLLVKES